MKAVRVFLDDGGVLHDNEQRSAEWRRLVGEYLAPRLGGRAEAWGDANSVVFAAQWSRFEGWSEAHAQDDYYTDFFASGDENTRWLTEMCDVVGVRAPTGARCVALAAATQRYVRARVRSGFADAVPAVRALAQAGYALSTCSGEASRELAGYLEALDIRGCFTGNLYGPDLVQTHKASSRYHERILYDTATSPSDAIFVDDNPKAVAWAAQSGARAVHVCRNGEPSPDADHVVADLFGLVELLEG